jgi:hypothetical protein
MGIFDFLLSRDDSPKRIFVSFAIEDERYRDFLVSQARNERSPFEFMDMSVKTPYRRSEWQNRCRTKIRRCHGVIVLLSKNTCRSSGARWEIRTAREEGIPIIGMHISKDDCGAIPPELKGKRVITWKWRNIENFIESL